MDFKIGDRVVVKIDRDMYLALYEKNNNKQGTIIEVVSHFQYPYLVQFKYSDGWFKKEELFTNTIKSKIIKR